MRNSLGKVVTDAKLNCDRQVAWRKIGFYEHISIRPSLLLRLVLPVPEKTTGRYGRVGDVSRCCYSDGGYLTKRIRKIVADERIDFEIIEQSIRYHRTIRLLGGRIEVTDAGGGRCAVRMTTYYRSSLAPAPLFHWAIARVVKAMHQIVLKDMQISLAGEPHERDAVQLQA